MMSMTGGSRNMAARSMKHAEYWEQVIGRQIRLMHKRGIWVKPEH